MLGFGLVLFAQVAEAKAPVVSIATTVERGSFVSISAGTKWKSKPVVVEVGVKSKKTWKWSRVASSRTDKSGKTTMCSSRTLNAGTQLRVKSGAKVISTIKISRTIALSGCGYVPPVAPGSTVAPLGAGPTPTTPGATTPSQSVSTTVPPTTVPPTTTPATTVPPTTVPPTTAPPTTTTVALTTTTTVPASTPAPTALALSAATDTGDSQSDGITKADTLIVVGNAEASSSVQIYVDGASSGSACTTNGSGAFSCTLGTVPAGTKAVTAKATGANGESVASQALTIVVDRTAPTVTMTASAASANSGVKTGFTITVSENTTSLTNSSLSLTCTRWVAGGLCVQEDFSGSGRNYFVNGTLVRDAGSIPAGLIFQLNANAFSDIAGNSHTGSVAAGVAWDYAGPIPSVTRVGSLVTITFSDIPVGFDASQLELLVFDGGIFAYKEALPLWNFMAVGTSGRVWSFNVSSNLYNPYNREVYREYFLQILEQKDSDDNVESTMPISFFDF
jgi:hypothetical protein